MLDVSDYLNLVNCIDFVLERNKALSKPDKRELEMLKQKLAIFDTTVTKGAPFKVEFPLKVPAKLLSEGSWKNVFKALYCRICKRKFSTSFGNGGRNLICCGEPTIRISAPTEKLLEEYKGIDAKLGIPKSILEDDGTHTNRPDGILKDDTKVLYTKDFKKKEATPNGGTNNIKV